MSQNTYYNTVISDTVRLPGSDKLYRISKRKDVPYITYKRKTRVLFEGPLKQGAFINVDGGRVYFK